MLIHAFLYRYVEDFMKRRAEWSLAFRSGEVLRGHHTNNFAEATMCVIKDIVLNRCVLNLRYFFSNMCRIDVRNSYATLVGWLVVATAVSVHPQSAQKSSEGRCGTDITVLT